MAADLGFAPNGKHKYFNVLASLYCAQLFLPIPALLRIHHCSSGPTVEHFPILVLHLEMALKHLRITFAVLRTLRHHKECVILNMSNVESSIAY